MALRARFREAGGVAATDDERALLELLLEHSPYLMELLIADPSRLAPVAADPYLRREKPRDVMRAQLGSGPVREYRHREYVRLGARELGGWGGFEEVARELAHLADVCFEAAVGDAERFVVFAMGKHGGEELNFSSDVDVLYVYDGEVDEHEQFARLSDRVTRAVAEATDHGFCFRVDLRLRPEGQRGPIVNSVTALERYYETWGRPWERQAWIKARPAAGDARIGAEVLAMLQPFVYPRTVGSNIVDDVRLLLGRAQAERRDKNDVKLGPGGIREIEFFVQALQLLHGGKQPALRERTTLRALDKVLFAGLISAREHEALSEAFVFLRRVENRLQLDQGAQTHEIPDDDAARDALARRMGFASTPGFFTELEHHRERVRALWKTLGVVEPPPLAVDFSQVPFRDRESAGDEIALLAQKPNSPFAPAAEGPAAALAPILVEELAECPDPDQALRHLTDFVGRRGPSSGVWRLLDQQRPLAKLLISLFGTSEFLARRLVEHADLIDHLLALGETVPLDQRLAAAGGDYEAELRAMRRFKQEEELRIGLNDIAGALDVDQVFTELSLLAEKLITAALAMVLPKAIAPLAVIALGKLGAREIDYGSDLDLIFVHGGAEVEDHERTARIAQRFIRALSAYMENGRLYQIDTRLRPSGRQGLLVTTLPAFVAYHNESAQLWERQALIKARAVAGDAALCDAFERARNEIVFDRPLPPDAGAQIARLRARMENELAGESAALYNPKLGVGGLVDIEFVVQFHQLMHGQRVPAARARSTRESLDALSAAGVLDSRAHATLRDAYRFLRRLLNRMRIVHDRPEDHLSAEPGAELDKLARRMGYRGAEAASHLVADYRATTGKVRALYSETFA